MKKSDVTVIVPVYNGMHFLEETLQSILQSKFDDWFCVIVDDGSTDDSGTIALSYQTNFPNRFKVFQTTNKGESEAINLAFNESDSKYVLVVSCDDPIHPSLLREAFQLLENNPEAVACYPHWSMINEDNKVIRRVKVRRFDVESMAVFLECIPGPGGLIRRSAIRRASLRKKEFRFVGDLEQWIYISQFGPMLRLNKYLAYWRLHRNNSSSIGIGRLNNVELDKLSRSIEAEYKFPNYYPKPKSIRAGLKYKKLSQLLYSKESVNLTDLREVVTTLRLKLVRSPRRALTLAVVALAPWIRLPK